MKPKSLLFLFVQCLITVEKRSRSFYLYNLPVSIGLFFYMSKHSVEKLKKGIIMNSLNKEWDELQLALRSGYVITLRELACAPECFCLCPEQRHPTFIIKAMPGNFKKDEIKRFLGHMKVDYRLLPAKHPNN